ncbi:DNA-directed RNA polymerase I subunit RPA12 isoform X2 [Lemur catta]|uniref:DNA-directed RNA polymerase I subunit RPA12 isoform X2 n=1 Tax=Lemur catta TaxID=9447 RepID=UPI001E26E348|nr:DNA-directed RNA polymerase I subunit RPA12 isoform X2 [Lemur catta]
MSVMDPAGTCSRFQSDLDFCPDCGSVLPLPGAQDAVTCARCGFSISVRGEGLVRSGRGGGPRLGGWGAARLRGQDCEDFSCVPQAGDRHACVGGGRARVPGTCGSRRRKILDVFPGQLHSPSLLFLGR